MNEPRQLKPYEEVARIVQGDSMRQKFATDLPKHIDPERFARVAATAIVNSAANGQDLAECERNSLFAAMSKCAQLGLLPDGREAALVKYGNKCQLLPMVEGLMKLVRNSGEVNNWSIQVVHERDQFDYELGDNERMVHKPALKDRGEILGAYSIVTLKGGEKSREWMDREQIEAIRKRTRGGGTNGPWSTDYSEMCRKTVARRHYKRLPKSTDLDGLMLEDDELTTAAPPAVPQVEKEVQGHVVNERPSRLQKVVDMEPAAEAAPAETKPAADTVI